MDEKKKKIILGIVITVVVVLVCALCYFASSAASTKAGDTYSEGTTSNQNTSASDMTTRAQEESANIPEDEQKEFNEIDVDTYLDMYDGDEDSLVLFASPTCGYCQIAEPILKHISYQYDITINYVNTSEIDSDDSEKLIDSNDFFSQLGTPTLLVVSNGKIVNQVAGLVDTDSYVSFFKDTGFIKQEEKYEKCL